MMTPEQMRVALLNWAGWRLVPSGDDAQGHARPEYWLDPDECPGDCANNPLPNYPKDLNAVRLLEFKLFDEYHRCNYYASELESVLERKILQADPKCTPDVIGFEMIHATAADKCEALCRVLFPDRWKTE